MTKEKATEVEQSDKKMSYDLIPEGRLQEILNILLPWGYSYHDGVYTGVSPFIGDDTNIITIVANNFEVWGCVFSICMERFNENCNENDSLGFYKGIMKLIAPELHSNDDEFAGLTNTLDFNWAPDNIQDNRFPVKVEYCKK